MSRRARAAIAATVLATLSFAAPAALAGRHARLTDSVTPTPSPTPIGRHGGSAGTGFVIVLVVLMLAALWQLQRGRRSTREYAELATSHFERSLKAAQDEDVGEE